MILYANNNNNVEEHNPSVDRVDRPNLEYSYNNLNMEMEYDCDMGESPNMFKAKDSNDVQSTILSDRILGSKEMVSMNDVEMKTCNELIESSQQNRMRIALGVLIRLVVPLCNGVVRGWQGLRGVRLLNALRNLGASRHMLTNMLAYAANTISTGLSSVQVSYRIDPILKIMKLKKGSTERSISSSSTNSTLSIISSVNGTLIENEITEKCVTLNILAEPPAGVAIRADIVFIHGLHGSLVNTWKQGIWNSDGRRVKFERPPRPPLRPPKRPRHSRGSRITSPHFHKRPRYNNVDDCFIQHDDVETYENEARDHDRSHVYECGQPDVISNCDGVEYSFPTFRLRSDEDVRPTNQHSFSQVDPAAAEKQSSGQEAESEKYSACWPGDWLPLDCPGVRVIAVNYTTDPYLWRPLWVRKRQRTSLSERTREMTDMLIENRVGYGHPIIWVGHSKGGIFIKQIIVDAWESGRPSAAPLWRFSRGVFFYSVPHRGSPLADFNLPFLRQSVELTEIQKNCASILDLHRRFVALYDSGHLKIDVFSFVETALTLMSVLYLRIVGIDSADPGIGRVCGLHLDHREICKPRSRSCILYTELVDMINRVS